MEIINDRNHFTLTRVVEGKECVEVYSRGEEVRLYMLYSKSFEQGVIEGISHTKKKVRVSGIWYDFSFVYKLEKEEITPSLPVQEELPAAERSIDQSRSFETIPNKTREGKWTLKMVSWEVGVPYLYVWAYDSVRSSEGGRRGKIAGQLKGEGWGAQEAWSFTPSVFSWKSMGRADGERARDYISHICPEDFDYFEELVHIYTQAGKEYKARVESGLDKEQARKETAYYLKSQVESIRETILWNK